MIEDPKDVEMKEAPVTKEETKNVLLANLIYAGSYCLLQIIENA